MLGLHAQLDVAPHLCGQADAVDPPAVRYIRQRCTAPRKRRRRVVQADFAEQIDRIAEWERADARHANGLIAGTKRGCRGPILRSLEGEAGPEAVAAEDAL